MSARQNKKRKGRNHINNRERTVTTFTEDPNTSFLVPLSSEDPPAVLASPFSPSSFSMPYQNYVPQQQQQFYQPVLPSGKNDLEILENLKTIIREGQHEFYRAVPQPAVLASLYVGHNPQQAHQDPPPQDHATPQFAQDSADGSNAPDLTSQSANNTVEAHTPLSGADTSSTKLGADPPNASDSNASSVKPDPDDTSRIMTQGSPVNAKMDTKTDVPGEYGAQQSVDFAPSNKPTQFDAAKDDEPSQLTGGNTWEHHTPEERRVYYDDRSPNPPQSRASTYDDRHPNGTTTSAAADARPPPAEDRRFYARDRDKDKDTFIDRDRDRDRDWDRDRDRHDSIRDIRDRDRDRDIRDRRPEFFGRSYGRSHAPRPPPELRHYEPSYGPDYVPPRRYDPDDRRGGLRNASFDDRPKPPPFDDRRPPIDDRRLPPSSAIADDRRLALDDRPSRPLAGSDSRALPPSSEERARPLSDSMPLTRAAAEKDDRGVPVAPLTADDRPRTHVPLEERLSQPAPTPSLQDRLSQPARVDITSAPSLEERLSLGPVPRAYARASSVPRDDLRAPLHKDDPRDHDHIGDFRTSRDFSRERTGGPLSTASTYRPDPDRGFGERYDRDRRDRDMADADPPPTRFGDTFSRTGPLLPRRYSPPPPIFDRDRERERGRTYYPTRSPPPSRGEGVYDPEGERRYATDRDRDFYEQRRRDWYGPGDDDKRALIPPPSASWRPHERPPFVDRDRDRFDRERERDRDMRERDRERERDLGRLVPPPTRGQWEDRDRRGGFSNSPPHPRMDTTGGVGPSRSLSARLTDPYLPPPSGGSDERTYPPLPREFDRGRYGGPALDDHPHGSFSRIRGRSPSPPRRGPVLAEEMRPPLKRVRDDNGPGYAGVGLGVSGGASAAYSPPRRSGVGVNVNVGGGMGGTVAGEYVSGPPPSSAATTGSVVTSVSGTAPSRSTGTRTPPVSVPPPSSGASSAFYERDREREREQRERERERDRDREREYVRGEYGMGYDRDSRGRRSPPLLGSRMGSGPGSSGGGYGRGVIVDRRDDRRYVPLPPRTS